jgi:hypothetical protein
MGDDDSTGRPPRGRHAMLDEALDLVDTARGDGVEVRLVGGLAVLALCPHPKHCRREHRDLDLVAARRDSGRLLATFARLGYEENRHVRLASSGALLQVYRPCVHRGSHGELVHSDDRVDVYLDAFRLHHTLPLKHRLRREPYTLAASDVLLAKLLRTRMSRADAVDSVALLLGVGLRDEETPGTIGLRYVARVCTRDWGLYHDVTGNLRLLVSLAEDLRLDATEAHALAEAARGLLEAMRGARKGARWRLRAAIGERLPWYDAVDENDGQRISLRERPAEAWPSAGAGRA